jgi:hypothetical protein
VLAAGGAKPAASGCGGAGRRSSSAGPQSRVSGHGWGRGGHPRDARGLARLVGAAATAEGRRGDRSTQRHGFGAAVNSGEVFTVSRVHGIKSNYTGRLPTFLRSSESTPCRRSGDDGENPKAAALGFRRGRGARGGGRLG